MKLLLLGALAAPLTFASVFPNLHVPLQSRQSNQGDVMIQMFEWNWDSIAAECSNFIGPANYTYIQVSPAHEHIDGSPWWTSYQPVRYTLQSKRGSRDQFRQMVSTCNDAGIGVVVDVIVNHMSGVEAGTGIAGSPFTHFDYPGLYGSSDFHYCGTPGDTITNWNSSFEIQNCELFNLADLKTESPSVRSKIAQHLQDLLSLGVAGFRIDAAKHVPVADITAILAQIDSPRFIVQEVFNPSATILPSQYEGNGDVTEFAFERVIKNAFTGVDGASLSGLRSIGGSGFVSSNKATIFVATHDTERNGEALTVNSPSKTYVNAHVFMLAFTYGHPMVLSSFAYAQFDDGAPNSGHGTCIADGGANGYHCQHRWVPIRGMVNFRLSAGNTGITNWVSPQSNRIAFGRGSNAYVAINNDNLSWNATFTTSLPDGIYCDVISSSSCSRRVALTGGTFQATVPGRSSLAIHIGRTSDKAPDPPSLGGQPLHPNGDKSRCVDVAGGIFANGTPVQMYDCLNSPAQSWVIQPGSTKVRLANTDFCLDASPYPGNGVKVKLWQCYDDVISQQWYFSAGSRLTLEGQGQCLDLTDGNKANGNQLQIWACSNSSHQVWSYGS